jgi:hypothetical protein
VSRPIVTKLKMPLIPALSPRAGRGLDPCTNRIDW